ncbi:predicted protein [Lichtheimia corymbifera JMRC:FSU:9682]|uniref:Uncharacterized protein n=1 Tax=Lichtheimia corymbifera JMRC:FSU:9682 TaxID=1263082 RepID=A0A068S6J0_9FUNG|nr:predicted protein [Lichtheimia corymbifera JMRC:FSU:9682]
MTSQRVSKFMEHQNEMVGFYNDHSPPPPPPYSERDQLLLSSPPPLLPQIPGYHSVQHKHSRIPPSSSTICDISKSAKHYNYCTSTRQHINSMLQQFRQYMNNRRANRREKRPQDGKTNPFE